MAEYTDKLKLFKPGTDDNVGVEASLEENFSKIDTKLGDMLKDLDGKEWDSAGARVNEYQRSLKTQTDDITKLKKKNPNERLDHHFVGFESRWNDGRFDCLVQYQFSQ